MSTAKNIFESSREIGRINSVWLSCSAKAGASSWQLSGYSLPKRRRQYRLACGCLKASPEALAEEAANDQWR